MRSIRLIFDWVFSVSCILLGPLYAVYGIGVIASAADSRSWTKAVGRIISSEVAEHGGGRGTNFRPEVRYEYKVGQSIYQGSSIWLLAYGADLDWAKSISAQFPVGSSVPVFYKTDSPEQAILKPSTNWHMFFTGGIGVVAFVVGVAGCPCRRFLQTQRPAAVHVSGGTDEKRREFAPLLKHLCSRATLSPLGRETGLGPPKHMIPSTRP